MTSRTITTILTALMSLSLFGCAELFGGLGGAAGVEPPTAEYRDFRLSALSLDEVDFDLDFDLGNPNDFPLPVATMDWNLDLFHAPFSFGEIRFEDAPAAAPSFNDAGGVLTFLGIKNIPAGGAMSLETPFTVALMDTFEGIARVAMGEDIPYTIGGVIHFETTFADFDLPFSVDGVWENGTIVDLVTGIGGDLLPF